MINKIVELKREIKAHVTSRTYYTKPWLQYLKDCEARLKEFYSPHNEQLIELVRKRFDWYN